MKKSIIFIISFVSLLGLGVGCSARIHPSVLIPYHSQRFNVLLRDSFDVFGKGEPRDFYKWMDNAYETSKVKYPGREGSSLNTLLRKKRIEMAAYKNRNLKTQAELDMCRWLHKFVKKAIPRFSLDRGYEFCSVMNCGERQCLLQSVLISGLLQDIGVNAGIVMVNRNNLGSYSNNGHVVCIVKLANGKDIQVDASDPVPFMEHQGILARAGNYAYLHPVFAKDFPWIIDYDRLVDGKNIAPERMKTLDWAYVRSQFYYYRGERVPGGFMSVTRSKKGLAASAVFLKKSVELCPQNPLAVYMLGLTYLTQGDTAKGTAALQRSWKLYKTYGWVPDGAKPYAPSS